MKFFKILNLFIKAILKVISENKLLSILSIWFFLAILYVVFLIKNPEIEQNNSSKINANEQTSTIQKTAPAPIDHKTNYEDLIKLKYSWRLGGFGRVAFANVQIKNESEFDIKDIPMRCSFYSESETLLHSTDVTLFKIFKHKKTTNINEISLGFIPQFTKSLSCNLDLSSL